MYMLDTDHISLLDRGGREGQRIRANLAPIAPDEVAASIVSYEEQMRGWISTIARARLAERQVPFYRELEWLLRFYSITPLLPFDEAAAAVFDSLKQTRVRMGTMDLKIAAIALANDATLLSRNLSDFRRVPGLTVEDWTI